MSDAHRGLSNEANRGLNAGGAHQRSFNSYNKSDGLKDNSAREAGKSAAKHDGAQRNSAQANKGQWNENPSKADGREQQQQQFGGKQQQQTRATTGGKRSDNHVGDRGGDSRRKEQGSHSVEDQAGDLNALNGAAKGQQNNKYSGEQRPRGEQQEGRSGSANKDRSSQNKPQQQQQQQRRQSQEEDDTPQRNNNDAQKGSYSKGDRLKENAANSAAKFRDVGKSSGMNNEGVQGNNNDVQGGARSGSAQKTRSTSQDKQQQQRSSGDAPQGDNSRSAYSKAELLKENAANSAAKFRNVGKSGKGVEGQQQQEDRHNEGPVKAKL